METQRLLPHKVHKTSHLSTIFKLIMSVIILLFISYFCSQQSIIEHALIFTKTDTTVDSQRILIYYSPNENEANDFNLIDLINVKNLNPLTNSPYITNIEISTIHLKKYDNEYWPIHLNDLSPNSARFIKLGENIASIQEYGVKVLFMIGGWEGIDGNVPYSDSSFINLFNEWDIF
eukprot:396599_1